MKKLLSLVLILALLCSTAMLFACGAEDNAEDGTTTTTTTTTRRTEKEEEEEKPEEEPEAPALADGTRFALDGDLAEWADTKTLFIQGEENENLPNSGNKKVTFYGVLADDGLHLACDAYHDIYIPDATSDWWRNSNYEFFIGVSSNAQKYVYARGIGVECSTSGSDVNAVMVTEEINGITKYHTITEVFVPMEELYEGDIYYNTIDVGVAWKTIGDVIIGGAGVVGTYNEDEYWVPKGTWPNNQSKAIVAPSGIYLPEDYDY